MNFLAAIFNVSLAGYTCFVLLTEGMPKNVAYFLFTLFLLLVPVLNLCMILIGARSKGWFSFNIGGKESEEEDIPEEKYTSGKILKTTAIISNIVLVGLSCLAFIDQYPHPKEDGLVVFIVLLLFTPVVSLLMILRNGAKIIHDDMNME